MADPPAPRPRLGGVRLERNGPVLFIDAGELELTPGQLVVIESAGEEALASVIFGPQQLASNESPVGPAGKVIRVANEQDVLRLVRSVSADNGVSAAGLPKGWADWLAGPRDEPAVRVALDDDAPTVSEFIERMFPGAESSSSR
jgi:hypothetical protein